MGGTSSVMGIPLGTKLGSYQVLSLLGEGGMGSVYLAEHETIGSKVAIKVLKESCASQAGLLQRFFDEARVVNLIDHPSIVRVFDFAEASEVGPYYVMECLKGESLADFLDRCGPLPLSKVARLIARIAAPLAAAHEHDVVHRDLKSENVFLIPDPDYQEEHKVKLLDFGIARLAHAPRHTGTHQLMGTPEYMSPEQCRGAKNVDKRSDVFALATIAYECCSGRTPFMGLPMAGVLCAQLDEIPSPPSHWRNEIPEVVDAVIMQSLAKSPDERHQSAGEFSEALAAVVSVDLSVPDMGEPTLVPVDQPASASSIEPTIPRHAISVETVVPTDPPTSEDSTTPEIVDDESSKESTTHGYASTDLDTTSSVDPSTHPSSIEDEPTVPTSIEDEPTVPTSIEDEPTVPTSIEEEPTVPRHAISVDTVVPTKSESSTPDPTPPRTSNNGPAKERVWWRVWWRRHVVAASIGVVSVSAGVAFGISAFGDIVTAGEEQVAHMANRSDAGSSEMLHAQPTKATPLPPKVTQVKTVPPDAAAYGKIGEPKAAKARQPKVHRRKADVQETSHRKPATADSRGTGLWPSPYAPPGFLAANTYPWSNVIIDGKDTKRTTPIQSRPLSPGPHKVTFLANGKRFTYEVTIRSGKVTRLIKSLPLGTRTTQPDEPGIDKQRRGTIRQPKFETESSSPEKKR